MKVIHEKWKGRSENLKLALASRQLAKELKKSNQFDLEDANKASNTTLTIMRTLNNSLQCDSLFKYGHI